MTDIDERVLDEFADEIYKKIEAKFRKLLNGINVELNTCGLVDAVSADNKTADIKTIFCTLTSIPNLSGETLNKGNKVKVFYNRRDMSDAYIGVKF